MPGFDYSKFDKLDCSDSEDEQAEKRKQEEKDQDDIILESLPKELSPELSLVLAARHGQQNVVEALLNKRAQVNATDPHGATALLKAVEGGITNRQCIETLLKRGASIDQMCEGGHTALGRAACCGTVEVCQALIEASNPSDETRATALAAASITGNAATCEFLLRMNASPCFSSENKLPLNSWAKHGNQHLAELLLKRRADISACDDQGTPLTCAVQSGSISLVQWLCAQGADANRATIKGRSPLIEAVEHSNEQTAGSMVSSLLELSANLDATSGPRGSSPFVAAACKGRPAVGKLLLDAKVDVNAADLAGRRPLPCAALVGSSAFCQLLLDNGVSVDERGTDGATASGAAPSKGVTALSVVAAAGDITVAKLLVQVGANCELVDERDFTPLMVASRNGNKAMIDLLLGGQADVNARQAESLKTSLLLAAGVGSMDACAALISARADVEARTDTQVTPLHAAAANGHEDVCRHLVASGASVHAQGPGGHDAAAMATAAGHTSLAEVLAIL